MLVNSPMSYQVLRQLPLQRPQHPRLVQTVVTRGRTQGTFARTILLFWFVVGMFVGVALMKSAVGHSDTAQRIAKQIRSLVR